MALRIRMVNGVATVAVCAAKSIPKEGDIYLDDDQYHVVMNKFARDFNEMYDLDLPVGTDEEVQLALQEESNNRNRTKWDKWIKQQLLKACGVK